MAGAVTVRCVSCGTLNRVPAEKVGEEGRCGICGSAIRAAGMRGKAVDVHDGDFHDLVLGSDLPVLLEFWAPSCGHCIRMDPVLDELASEYTGRLLVAKMDVTANSRTPSDFGIRGTPAFYVFKGGKAAASFAGAMPKGELLNRLHGLL
ncbi:MAG TPA: thioredoxin family protein [Nitrospirota bacterium]|jgi:thioredoxin 2